MQKLGMKYGLICGLVYVIFGMGSILLGPEAQSSLITGMLLGLATVVSTFFVIFYGVKEFRDSVNGGSVTIGEAVKLGALIALIAALLAAAFTLFYNFVIDPGYADRMMDATREQFEDRGMTDEQIDQAMGWGEMLRSPVLQAAFTVVWYSLWGLLKGLISGAILKREPAPTA